MTDLENSEQFPNGYTRIPNELLDAIIASRFTAQQRRIIDLIMRMTYGCHNKYLQLDSWLELSVIGIDKSDYKKHIQHLELSKVIFVDWENRRIKLNSDFNQWRISIPLGHSIETYKEFIHRHIQLNNENDRLVTHQPLGWIVTNQEVGELPTKKTSTDNDDADSGVPKESIKDNIKETLPLVNNIAIDNRGSKKRVKEIISIYKTEKQEQIESRYESLVKELKGKTLDIHDIDYVRQFLDNMLLEIGAFSPNTGDNTAMIIDMSKGLISKKYTAIDILQIAVAYRNNGGGIDTYIDAVYEKVTGKAVSYAG